MGFARPITIDKSEYDFICTYSFFVGTKRINLRCLIDTGADNSMISEEVVNDFRDYIYGVVPVTFRSLTSTFQLYKKINLVCEWDMQNQLSDHSFFVSKREFQNMPFDVIIGKDILARYNAKLVFDEKKDNLMNVVEREKVEENNEDLIWIHIGTIHEKVCIVIKVEIGYCRTF